MGAKVSDSPGDLARLAGQMVKDFKLDKGAKVLIPAAGEGELIDHWDQKIFKNIRITFTETDLPSLEKINERLRKKKFLASVVLDDIEHTTLGGMFDGILGVFLSDRLEWRRALEQMFHFSPIYLYLAVRPERVSEMTSWLKANSFKLEKQYDGEKQMTGLVFIKKVGP
jgi:hypothetical protein